MPTKNPKNRPNQLIKSAYKILTEHQRFLSEEEKLTLKTLNWDKDHFNSSLIQIRATLLKIWKKDTSVRESVNECMKHLDSIQHQQRQCVANVLPTLPVVQHIPSVSDKQRPTPINNPSVSGLVTREGNLLKKSSIPNHNIFDPKTSLRLQSAKMGQTMYPPQIQNKNTASSPYNQNLHIQEPKLKIYDQLMEILPSKSAKEQNVTITSLNPIQVGHLAQYINKKTEYSPADQHLLKLLFHNHAWLKKVATNKYPHLLSKLDLGTTDWKIAKGLVEKGYSHLKKIGQGGMGTVFLAKYTILERLVAVKVITSEHDLGRDVHKEAKFGARFTPEDGVIQVYDAGHTGEYPYIAMSYLEGVQDLQDLDKNLSLLARLVACYRMTEIVRIMHEEGVIHKDFKPENFLSTGVKSGDIMTLLKDMHIYGSDFGLAKDSSEKDVEGLIMGTPLFMPPEQAKGEQLDASADVYALGISIYNVLTGKSPYPEDKFQNSLALLTYVACLQESAIENKDAMNLLDEKHVPLKIINLIVKMTDPDPEKRPSMDEVYDVFEEYINSQKPEVILARRNKFILEMMLKVGLPTLLILSILVGSFLSSSRPEAHIQFGGQRIAALKALQDAKDLESKRLALKQYKQLLSKNRPEGYEREEGEPQGLELQEKAESVRRDIENAEKASSILEKAEKLLKGKNPDFDSIRAMLRKALKKSGTVKAEVERMLNEVDVVECGKAYEEGVRAYRMGEVGVAKERFSRSIQLKNAGLSSKEKKSLEEQQKILKGWEERSKTLQKEASKVSRMNNFVLFEMAVNEWQQFALQKNKDDDSKKKSRDSISKIIILRKHLGKYPPAVLAKMLREKRTSYSDMARTLKGHPDFILYQKKLHLARDILSNIGRSFDTQITNPGTIRSVYEHYIWEINLSSKMIPMFLRNRNFVSAQKWTHAFFVFVRDFSKRDEECQLKRLSSEMNIQDYLSSQVLTVFQALRDVLPGTEKDSLLQELERDFSDCPLIVENARKYLQ